MRSSKRVGLGLYRGDSRAIGLDNGQGDGTLIPMRQFLFIAVALLAAGLVARGAAAQELAVIRHLDFGTFALIDNNTPYTILVKPDNDVVYDAAFLANIQAERGEYALTNFPPNITLYTGVDTVSVTPPFDGGVTLTDATDLTSGAGPVFTVADYTTNDPTTDNNGDAMLYIGATLSTSGTGQVYGSAVYTGSIDVTFYF